MRRAVRIVRTTRADLDAHANGAALGQLNRLNQDPLQRPYDVWFLDPVPLGNLAKGTIPEPPEN